MVLNSAGATGKIGASGGLWGVRISVIMGFGEERRLVESCARGNVMVVQPWKFLLEVWISEALVLLVMRMGLDNRGR